MKILISGFEAFQNLKINPSEVLVQNLRQMDFDGAQIKGAILPVSYNEAFNALEHSIIEFKPDYVLATGVAVKRKSLCLERLAKNIQKSSQPDNDGEFRTGQKIIVQGPEVLSTNLPLLEILEELKGLNVPVQISEDAGAYVCNFLMYELLRRERTYKRIYKSGFIHLPNSRHENPYKVSMSDEEILKAFETIIQVLKNKPYEQ